MKTIIFVLTALIYSASANALTLKQCLSMSDEQIASQLLQSIAYGAQNGRGNKLCQQKASQLLVSTSSEYYSEIKNHIISDSAKLEIINTFREEDDFGQVTAIYEVRDGKKTMIGEFKFNRTESPLDAPYINEYKCAMMPTDPTDHFMLASCR